LLLLLGGAAFIAYRGLTVDRVNVPASGYIAMTVGVVSLIVGVGLMVLVFYSSRKDMTNHRSWCRNSNPKTDRSAVVT
jgi:hypothetical protein